MTESRLEQPPGGAAFPPPHTPPVGLPRPVLLQDRVPADPVVTELSVTELSVPEVSDADLALAALASMSREELATPTGRSLDLPPETRGPLVQLLRTRSQLWTRLDAIRARTTEFERIADKVTRRGRAPEAPEYTLSADPESELTALALEISAGLGELEELMAQRHALKNSLEAKRSKLGVKKLERQATEFNAMITEGRVALRGLLDHGLFICRAAEDQLTDLLHANGQTLREIEETTSRPEHSPWDLARWVEWTPSHARPSGDVRLGTFTEVRSGETLAVPCVAPLVGSGRSLVLEFDGDAEAEAANELLQSLVIRTAATFPQQAGFLLLDPATNGLAFPMTRHLPNATMAGTDVRRQLDDMVAHVQRIVGTYLDASKTSFDEIPEELRLGETYRFVVAADFPHAYDRRSAEVLRQLARTGPRAGVYVILQLNRDRLRDTPEFGDFSLPEAVTIDVGQQEMTIGDTVGTVTFDLAPAAAIQETVLHRIAAMPLRDRAVTWDEMNRVPQHQWWQGSADVAVQATVGRRGAGEVLTVRFGTDEEQLRSCVHGVLGAMPGAGKSTLLHNLICSLAVRYSPQELQFVLIDGKYGVEFQPYRNLPHAQIVSLRTSPSMARSVLADLVDEMSRRNALFAGHGVADLTGYRRLAGDHALPRLVLIVDEYQHLFDGDRSGAASDALLRLTQQGRSAGIHVLLASQRFDAGEMLHRNEIFGNLHLRMAMQLSRPDAAALADFGATGRRLIASHCDRTGRIVVNDRGGDDTANLAGKAALLTPQRRDELVAALAAKAAGAGITELPIVLDGSQTPSFARNPHLQTLLEFAARPNPKRRAEWALAGLRDGGLGVNDWAAAERPLPLLLGKEFDVRRQAVAVLRRRSSENLLLLGERSATRLGMLASALTSAVLGEQRNELHVWVADAGANSSTATLNLARVIEQLDDAGVATEHATTPDALSAMLDAALAAIERRRSLSADELARAETVLLVMHQPERVAALHRIADEYGSIDSLLGQHLRLVLANGPTFGVHVIISTASLAGLRCVLADRVLQSELRHRVVLQVPEEDSFVLVRSTAAATLQAEGSLPEAALYHDPRAQISSRFQPYAFAEDGVDDGLRSDLDAVIARLRELRR